MVPEAHQRGPVYRRMWMGPPVADPMTGGHNEIIRPERKGTT
jgi:hypothetical protein